MTGAIHLLVTAVLLNTTGAIAKSSHPEESFPRIARLEAWMLAVEPHRPGAIDYSVRDIGLLNRPGPGGLTVFVNDGQRLGLQSTVSHWNYANLFLAAEFEALGNGAEARRSYERAAAIESLAQSPLFGLSRLADQAGDRAAAREAIARVLELPPNAYERTDPWWVYEVAQSRDIDRWLADIRQRP
jgi:tetratricopeptide (TPR) repeat protein